MFSFQKFHNFKKFVRPAIINCEPRSQNVKALLEFCNPWRLAWSRNLYNSSQTRADKWFRKTLTWLCCTQTRLIMLVIMLIWTRMSDLRTGSDVADFSSFSQNKALPYQQKQQTASCILRNYCTFESVWTSFTSRVLLTEGAISC